MDGPVADAHLGDIQRVGLVRPDDFLRSASVSAGDERGVAGDGEILPFELPGAPRDVRHRSLEPSEANGSNAKNTFGQMSSRVL